MLNNVVLNSVRIKILLTHFPAKVILEVIQCFIRYYRGLFSGGYVHRYAKVTARVHPVLGWNTLSCALKRYPDFEPK